MATFKFYSCNDNNGLPPITLYFFKFGGFERSVVLVLGTTH